MKNFKKDLSVRFKNPDKNDFNRMNIYEWENFIGKADYFRSSDDFLIEAAVEYKRHLENKLTPDQMNEDYVFEEKEFDSQAKPVSGLNELKKILKIGVLTQKMQITGKYFSLTVNENEALISYYPPYIIAIDTTYQTRITIDLSLNPTVYVKEKTIFVDFENTYE